MNPYKVGQELASLFARFEHALKRTDFLRDNRRDAQADWNKFARELGPCFFEHIRRSKLAETLIGDPPRKLMKEGLKWEPEHPQPLKDVVELFEQGVCRVRNSFIHGEKFVGRPEHWERDVRLVYEALVVLREAQDRVPSVANLLKKN